MRLALPPSFAECGGGGWVVGIAFFRDHAFVDDSARTNLQQVFNQFSPTTSIKVI